MDGIICFMPNYIYILNCLKKHHAENGILCNSATPKGYWVQLSLIQIHGL